MHRCQREETKELLQHWKCLKIEKLSFKKSSRVLFTFTYQPLYKFNKLTWGNNSQKPQLMPQVIGTAGDLMYSNNHHQFISVCCQHSIVISMQRQSRLCVRIHTRIILCKFIKDLNQQNILLESFFYFYKRRISYFFSHHCYCSLDALMLFVVVAGIAFQKKHFCQLGLQNIKGFQ